MTRATVAEPRVGGSGSGLTRWLPWSTTIERVVLGALGLAVIVVAWQAFVSAGIVAQLAFPSPGKTFEALVDLFASGEIYEHLWASGILFATGLAASVLLGVPIGFLAGWFPTVRGLLNPHIAVLYSIPSIALMPLFIVWLGFGYPSQFLVVLLFAFFPPYYAALESVASVDRSLIRMSQSFGSSDLRLFRAVVLPGSIPILLSGIRFAVGKAIAAVITAELYASVVGVGFLLNESGALFQTARVFAVVVVIAIIGVITSVILRWAEDRFDAWRPKRLEEV